jgi:hypothetical protein
MIFQCDAGCGRNAMYVVVYETKDGTVLEEQLCARCASEAGNTASLVREYKLMYRYRG